eukprot:16260159-Heterocapsa_arctica.AAC.1
MIGWCACDMPAFRAISSSFLGVLQRMMTKGTQARRLFDIAALIAHIWSPAMPGFDSQLWQHIAFRNFKTRRTT